MVPGDAPHKFPRIKEGVMQFVGRCLRISGLLVVVILGSTSGVQSQDLFREMNQVKSDLSSLKNEVNDLKRLVFELRKVVLEQAMASGRQPVGEGEAKGRKEEKETPPVDDEQITKTACRAVGQFFVEAESALRSADSSVATTKMNQALRKVTSALRGYSGTHRVNKLLRIYEGLAWSTYTAVQLRQSITGNEDFLNTLRKHKQKYIETCPRE
jgi:hypothetical protein